MDNIPIIAVVKGVAIINICQWIDSFYGEMADDIIDCNRTGIDLKAWCKNHRATYYAAPRESFSLHAAAMKALDEGVFRVVIEDLS